MMKTVVITAALLLCACSVERKASVEQVDANSGIVRLTYGQAMLQSAKTDGRAAQVNALKACQQMGYATAVDYGQPETTCTTFAGSLCLNEKITLQYQCRGIAGTLVNNPTW
ncbi:YecR family lipoprotein [uncultured Pluralibacter sp.]|uniref:YecR family lipoprotein n=1 Tax=uncultured Pluralibacter sp. TaxID=1490864 RepID=UPI002622A060|nr:YecR family lipoprotein [uncultured Pluralibacter sp.]